MEKYTLKWKPTLKKRFKCEDYWSPPPESSERKGRRPRLECVAIYCTILTGSEGSNASLLQQASSLALTISTLCTTSDKDTGGNLSESEDQWGSECTPGLPPLWAANQDITNVVPTECVNTTNITTSTSQRYTLTSFTSRGGNESSDR